MNGGLDKVKIFKKNKKKNKTVLEGSTLKKLVFNICVPVSW